MVQTTLLAFLGAVVAASGLGLIGRDVKLGLFGGVVTLAYIAVETRDDYLLTIFIVLIILVSLATAMRGGRLIVGSDK